MRLNGDMLRKGIIVTCLTLALTAATLGQVAGCPQGYVCLTQEAAQRAVENARLRPLLEQQIEELTKSRDAARQDAESVRSTAMKNEADLRKALIDTTVDYARASGELIQSKAEVVNLRTQVEFMLKNGRNKCGGFTLLCIQ